MLTLLSSGAGDDSFVQVEASVPVHVVQLAFLNISLQSYEDSHPLVGLESLSNFPLVHAIMLLQVETPEQAEHVVSAAAAIAFRVSGYHHRPGWRGVALCHRRQR